MILLKWTRAIYVLRPKSTCSIIFRSSPLFVLGKTGYSCEGLKAYNREFQQLYTRLEPWGEIPSPLYTCLGYSFLGFNSFILMEKLFPLQGSNPPPSFLTFVIYLSPTLLILHTYQKL